MSSFLNGLPYNATLDQQIKYSFYIAEKNCTLPSVLWNAETLPGVGISFHDLMTILSSVATVLCCLVCTYSTCGHFFHWITPLEQKQIVLCIWYLPIFTIINFFALWFDHSYDYITPYLQLYNAKGLISVLLLYVSYVCPNEARREAYHAELQRRWVNGKVKHDKGSLRWFRVIWVLVFQLVPLQLVLFAATYAVPLTTCPLSKARQTADYITESVQYVITSTAFTANWWYYIRVRDQLEGHRPGWKLNAFQSLVALQATQSLIFTLLGSNKAYFPTKYVSYQDFTEGVPAFMLCWESFLFSFIFVRAFSFAPYREKVLLGGHKRPASFGRAFLHTIDQTDLIRGTALMFAILFRRRGGSRNGRTVQDDEHAAEVVQLHQVESTRSSA